ncbi:hypothetical protein EON65_14955 [archaeon]|nr:MAG: hypothetical protein EON65_14955 [archaeon]
MFFFTSGTCQFGLAVSDVPKGDLDSSGTHDRSDITVSVNSAVYPYGTTELFPEMLDSDYKVLPNSAHDYAECSNAGICNRNSGMCECYYGFEGAACQRMTCPGNPPCSGHGVCRTMKQLAKDDFSGQYKLWNKDMFRGCLCDPGYYGGDCSLRKCKSAQDPMYFDDNSAVQYPMFFFSIMTTAAIYDLSDGQAQPQVGKFTLMVYDEHGQAYFTKPITAPASCNDLVKALEEIPQRVIPKGYTECFHSSFANENALTSNVFAITYEGLYRKYLSGTRFNTIGNQPGIIDAGYEASYTPSRSYDPDLTGDLYYLQFYGNGYNFNQPLVNIHLGDGVKPSLQSKGGVLVTRSWTNGQQGMGVDLFGKRCDSIMIRVVSYNGKTYAVGHFSRPKLFNCLGFADEDTSNDIESIEGEYDVGTIQNPFLVKLVRGQQDSREGGMLVLMFYDSDDVAIEGQSGKPLDDPSRGGTLRILHPFRAFDDSEFALWEVYSSRGKVQLIQDRAQAFFDFASSHIYTTNATVLSVDDEYDADISCSAFHRRVSRGYNVSLSRFDTNQYCLDNGDYFLIVDPYTTLNNAPFLNLYRAQSLINVNAEEVVEFEDLLAGDRQLFQHTYRRNLIISDINTNWAQGYNSTLGGKFHIYRFRPDPQFTYHYHAECANRGVCNPFEGMCECFTGYGGQACQTQDALVT